MLSELKSTGQMQSAASRPRTSKIAALARIGWRRTLNPLPSAWVIALAVLLVGIATVLLFHMQSIIMRQDNLPMVRPFTMGFLIPIIVMTVLAGRRAGILTVLMSAVAAAIFLAHPAMSWHIEADRSRVEIILLIAIGAFIVVAIGAMRENVAMLSDIANSPEGVELASSIKEAVGFVPGVTQIRAMNLRRRGLDLYIDADIIVDDSYDRQAASNTASEAERAIYALDPLIFQVRVRGL